MHAPRRYRPDPRQGGVWWVTNTITHPGWSILEPVSRRDSDGRPGAEQTHTELPLSLAEVGLGCDCTVLGRGETWARSGLGGDSYPQARLPTCMLLSSY